MWDGYREMVRAVMRQRREPGFYHHRELPPSARPYRPEFHDARAVPERESQAASQSLDAIREGA
jgi:hypothetical protein